MKEIFQTLVQEEKEKFKFFVVQIYILYMYATVCPRGLYPIYILIYNTKWVKLRCYMVNSNNKIIIFPRLHQIHFFFYSNKSSNYNKDNSFLRL